MTTDHDDLEHLVRTTLATLYTEPDDPGLIPAVHHRIRRRQRHRKIVTGATAAAAVAIAAATTPIWARGPSSGSSGSDASCAPIVQFRGGTFFGVLVKPGKGEVVVPAAHRQKAGTGTIPPCNDTNHSHGHSQTMTLYRINGFPTSALVADQKGLVWQRQAPNPSQLTLTHQAVVDGRALAAKPWVQTYNPS